MSDLKELLRQDILEGLNLSGQAIHGDEFIQLMAKTGVGLRPSEVHVVYEIDPNWGLAQ